MVQCISHLCQHGKTNWRKNYRYKEGYHSMQQPMHVNILWLHIRQPRIQWKEGMRI